MSATKKIQGNLKSLILTFGKLLQSWENDCGEVERILTELHKLLQLMAAIKRTLSSRKSRFEFLAVFPALESRLLAKISRDTEDLFRQIKLFWKRLGDVKVAMEKIASDSLRLIIGETPEAVQGGQDVFNSDHVLDVQDIQTNYSLEYDRKEKLLGKLFRESQPTGITVDPRFVGQESTYELGNEKLMSEFLSLWSDNASVSFVDHERVETFRLINNL